MSEIRAVFMDISDDVLKDELLVRLYMKPFNGIK